MSARDGSAKPTRKHTRTLPGTALPDFRRFGKQNSGLLGFYVRQVRFNLVEIGSTSSGERENAGDGLCPGFSNGIQSGRFKVAGNLFVSVTMSGNATGMSIERACSWGSKLVR